MEYNNFYNIETNSRIPSCYTENIHHNNFVNIKSKDNGNERGVLILGGHDYQNSYPNNFIGCESAVGTRGSEDLLAFPNQYWGTTSTDKISESIWDFWDYSSLLQLNYEPFLVKPDSLAHGIVWKVELNGTDPQDEQLDPIGIETVQFDVYFNRAMDINYTPILSFGVREPYTQHIVSDSALWSSDSSIWTANYSFGIETGDGINSIKVQGARDPEDFEIPPEYGRFQFVIQAASAASNQFLATGLVGKVDLEWPTAPSDDALGYNMYRIMKLTDSTYTDTTRINSELVTDTTYTDFAVIPDSTYRYAYKVLGTDMAESDYSKFIPATPVSAASGDANGDLSVNVLDIVAIVNYILEENPQPFLAEAADVNDDGSINVLDIVGVVNIILGAPQLLANAEPMEKVRLLIYNNRLVLENGENVAGLQLSLNHSETSTSEVRASKKLAGFEMGSVQKENRHNLVLYSLSGSRMADLQEIINIKGGQNINVDEVVACNAQGKPLSIEVIDMAHVEIPKKFVLCQNYPNPFNPITRIKYGLPNAAQVKISIYNLLGQYVRTLTEGMKESGYHEIIWDGKNEAGQLVSSGLYFYRIKANAFVETKKLLLVR